MVGGVTVECAGEVRREGVCVEPVTTPESSVSSDDGDGLRMGDKEAVTFESTSLMRDTWRVRNHHSDVCQTVQ